MGTRKQRQAKQVSGMDMLHGPLRRNIVLFAIPLALSSILQQLFNSADAIVGGQLIGNTALAAIGGTAPVITLLIGLFVGLGVGTNVAIAMHIGHGERHRVSDAVQTTAVLALVCSAALTAFGVLATGPILDAIDMPADALVEAAQYLKIYFAGSAFFLVYNFGSAVLRAKGDTRRPLYALAVAAFLNIGLNVVAVTVLHLGVVGIALATVTTNAVSAALVVGMLLREEEDFRLRPRHLRVDRDTLRTILYIGIPAGLQSVVFSLSNVVIQASVNSFGTDAIAGSSAAMNFEYYTYFFVSAFSQAAVTFIGQNHAAGNLKRCDAALRFCMGAAVVCAAVLSAVFVGLGNTSLGIFTTEAGALSFATIRMWHVEILECLPASYEVTAGALRGMGWSILPTAVVIVGSCVLRIVYVFTLFPLIYSFENLMGIYPVTWLITGATMIALYLYARKRAWRKAAEREAKTERAQAA